jgi:hypothetical protein
VTLTNDGRHGYWFTFNDGTGTETPVPYSKSRVPFAPTGGKACASGSGFTSWGADMGVSLNQPPGFDPACHYDASAYSGVTFMLSGAVQSGSLRFFVTTASTTAVADGGTCPCTATCNDHYTISLDAPTATPRKVIVDFAQLRQRGWGTAVTWNPAEVLTLVWQIDTPSSQGTNAGASANFTNLCVDDLEFF